jgi:hypothetical protein
MNADPPRTNWRLSLWIMIAPGVIVIVVASVVYLIALKIPGLEFGKFRLLATSLIGAVGVAAGLLLHRKAVADCLNVGRAYWKTVLFSLLSLVGGPALAAVLLDKATGLGFLLSSPAPILILRPRSIESYRTDEFAFTATTNALGFRDREIDLRHKAGLRILALGDSFTYGWGVDDAEAWPGVLERRLREQGRDVEVINLGCPGAGVDAYAEIAESIVPLSRPDIVLVGVLQGIDLKLLNLGKTSDRLYQSKMNERGRSSRSVAAYTLPNLCALLAHVESRRPRSTSAEQNREDWKEMTKWMWRRLTVDERDRFNDLDADVKRMFGDGDLNPWEVYFALKYPDYVSFTLTPDRTEVQAAVKAMAGHLARIKRTAEEVQAKTVVLSVPPAWYISRRALVSKRRVGYRLDDSAANSDEPDEVIRAACREAGIPFQSFNARFREIGRDEQWFFEFDGMYSARGQSIFGAEVTRAILRLMD